MDNYALSRDRAQAYFLNFDQQAIIDSWDLRHDEKWLYTHFWGQPYQICRSTGSVYRCRDGSQADHSEVLSIFDFLCHEGSGKYLSGHFAPVNSLRGGPRAVGVGTDFHSKTAARFDRNPDGFRQACIHLGGTPLPLGDIGFEFPLFGQMTVRLKFYHADEDFPASVTLLWDDNTLQYLFYETVFYIAGFLLGKITEEMNQH